MVLHIQCTVTSGTAIKGNIILHYLIWHTHIQYACLCPHAMALVRVGYLTYLLVQDVIDIITDVTKCVLLLHSFLSFPTWYWCWWLGSLSLCINNFNTLVFRQTSLLVFFISSFTLWLNGINCLYLQNFMDKVQWYKVSTHY